MGLLSANERDLQPRGGDILPKGWYWALVEEVNILDQKNPDSGDGGTDFSRRYGSLTTADGATEIQQGGRTFRIGNRKLFSHSWIDHANADAARIGNQEILKEAISAGIIPKPEKGEQVELPDYPNGWDDYAGVLLGRKVLVKVDHRMRRDRTTKQPMLDEENKPIMDVRVVDWKAP